MKHSLSLLGALIAISGLVVGCQAPAGQVGKFPQDAVAVMGEAGFKPVSWQKAPAPENLRFGIPSSERSYREVWCVIGNPTSGEGQKDVRLLVARSGKQWRVIYPALLRLGDDRSVFMSVGCTAA